MRILVIVERSSLVIKPVVSILSVSSKFFNKWPWSSLPASAPRYTLQSKLDRLDATLPAPPRTSFILDTRFTGTGASGEIRLTSPKT